MNIVQSLKNLFKKKEDPNVRDAISELIGDESEEKPSLNLEERELLANILELHDMTVEDVMVPRADMVAIDINSSYKDMIKLMRQEKYSRFPVYSGKLDDIRGFVHIKDLANCESPEKFDLSKMVCRLLFVPTSMPVMDLLTKMRQEQIPIAVIVDEYGGTDGVATAWDILREIMGDMQSPQEEDAKAKLIKEDGGTYLADARYPIDDLEEELGLVLTDDDAEEEVDTVGGLVLYLAGRVPDRKEVIEHPSGYEFEVVEATPRVVLQVRVLKKKEASS